MIDKHESMKLNLRSAFQLKLYRISNNLRIVVMVYLINFFYFNLHNDVLINFSIISYFEMDIGDFEGKTHAKHTLN
jgi:hypothetical protein